MSPAVGAAVQQLGRQVGGVPPMRAAGSSPRGISEAVPKSINTIRPPNSRMTFCLDVTVQKPARWTAAAPTQTAEDRFLCAAGACSSGSASRSAPDQLHPSRLRRRSGSREDGHHVLVADAGERPRFGDETAGRIGRDLMQ